MDKLYERATFISPFPVNGLVSGSGYEIAISFDDHYIRVETVPSPTTGKAYVLLYTTIGEMLTEWRFYHEMPKENRPIEKHNSELIESVKLTRAIAMQAKKKYAWKGSVKATIRETERALYAVNTRINSIAPGSNASELGDARQARDILQNTLHELKTICPV